MEEDKIDSEVIKDIVLKLVGSVAPVADATVDYLVSKNIDKLDNVIYLLLREVYYTASHHDSMYGSASEVGKKAMNILKRTVYASLEQLTVPVNRVELIDEEGRQYVSKSGNINFEMQFQDNGKTLKIFISK